MHLLRQLSNPSPVLDLTSEPKDGEVQILEEWPLWD
jgi:hypothetical protein